MRSKTVERTLTAAVVLYAALLLLAPLIAIFWSAISEGFNAFLSALTSPDAISSLKLTLLMAVGATAINTLFGMCVAWILVRDDFPGKRIINGLVDLPFALPIIHAAKRKLVRIRMFVARDDLRHDDAIECTSKPLHTLDFEAEHGQAFGRLFRRPIEIHVLFEPVQGDFHRDKSAFSGAQVRGRA